MEINSRQTKNMTSTCAPEKPDVRCGRVLRSRFINTTLPAAPPIHGRRFCYVPSPKREVCPDVIRVRWGSVWRLTPSPTLLPFREEETAPAPVLPQTRVGPTSPLRLRRLFLGLDQLAVDQ